MHEAASGDAESCTASTTRGAARGSIAGAYFLCPDRAFAGPFRALSPNSLIGTVAIRPGPRARRHEPHPRTSRGIAGERRDGAAEAARPEGPALGSVATLKIIRSLPSPDDDLGTAGLLAFGVRPPGVFRRRGRADALLALLIGQLAAVTLVGIMHGRVSSWPNPRSSVRPPRPERGEVRDRGVRSDARRRWLFGSETAACDGTRSLWLPKVFALLRQARERVGGRRWCAGRRGVRGARAIDPCMGHDLSLLLTRVARRRDGAMLGGGSRTPTNVGKIVGYIATGWSSCVRGGGRKRAS